MIKLSPIFAALLLVGCVSTAQQPQTTAPITGASNIAARAGLNAASQTATTDRRGFNNAVDAGITGSMAANMGAGGLGLGVLGWLANTDASTPWSSPTLLTANPNRQPIASLEKKLTELLVQASGHNLEAQGYTRVPHPKSPTFINYIKPGCSLNWQGYYNQSCSKTYGIQLAPTQGPGIYQLRTVFAGSDSSLEGVYRRMVAKNPKELSLYMPPYRAAGQTHRPRLIENGRETAL